MSQKIANFPLDFVCKESVSGGSRADEAFGTFDRATLTLLDGLAGRPRRRERNLKIGTTID